MKDIKIIKILLVLIFITCCIDIGIVFFTYKQNEKINAEINNQENSIKENRKKIICNKSNMDDKENIEEKVEIEIYKENMVMVTFENIYIVNNEEKEIYKKNQNELLNDGYTCNEKNSESKIICIKEIFLDNQENIIHSLKNSNYICNN